MPQSAQISKVQLCPALSSGLRDLPSLTNCLMLSYQQIVGPILQGIGGCRNDAILSQLGLKRADDLVCVLNLSLQVQGSFSPGEGKNDRTRLATEDPILLLSPSNFACLSLFNTRTPTAWQRTSNMHSHPCHAAQKSDVLCFAPHSIAGTHTHCSGLRTVGGYDQRLHTRTPSEVPLMIDGRFPTCPGSRWTTINAHT